MKKKTHEILEKMVLITSLGKDAVSSTIRLSGSAAVSNEDDESKSVTEEVIKPEKIRLIIPYLLKTFFDALSV